MHGYATKSLVFTVLYFFSLHPVIIIHEAKYLIDTSASKIIIESVPCTRSYQIHYFKSFNFVILSRIFIFWMQKTTVILV